MAKLLPLSVHGAPHRGPSSVAVLHREPHVFPVPAEAHPRRAIGLAANQLWAPGGLNQCDRRPETTELPVGSRWSREPEQRPVRQRPPFAPTVCGAVVPAGCRRAAGGPPPSSLRAGPGHHARDPVPASPRRHRTLRCRDRGPPATALHTRITVRVARSTTVVSSRVEERTQQVQRRATRRRDPLLAPGRATQESCRIGRGRGIAPDRRVPLRLVDPYGPRCRRFRMSLPSPDRFLSWSIPASALGVLPAQIPFLGIPVSRLPGPGSVGSSNVIRLHLLAVRPTSAHPPPAETGSGLADVSLTRFNGRSRKSGPLSGSPQATTAAGSQCRRTSVNSLGDRR